MELREKARNQYGPQAPLERNTLAHLAIGIFICLGHVGLIIVLQPSFNSQREPIRPAKEAMAVTFIGLSPEPELRSVTRNSLPIRPRLRATHQQTPSSSKANPSNQAQPMIAPIDWAREAERAAREDAARMQNEPFHSFGSHPKGILKRPSKPSHHQRGDIQRSEGGEIIEWIDERCYYSNQSPPSDGLPNISLPDTDLRRHAAPKKICKRSYDQKWDFEAWKKSKLQQRPEIELP